MPEGSPQTLPLEARLPFLDLRGYQRAWLGSDIAAALAIAFMVVPQGAAYALIAGGALGNAFDG